MSISLRRYTSADTDKWDSFCIDAIQSTFIHTRKFISYHRSRFLDLSLFIERNNEIVGLFPCAQSAYSPLEIISHPGITYGGVLHNGYLVGDQMLLALSEIKAFYQDMGYTRLIYRCIPSIYHKAPSEDDIYALFRLDATLLRCDLSSTIDLSYRLPIGSRRLRGFKKANREGITIREGHDLISKYWAILEDNLRSRHRTKPTHTLAEIQLLASRFPNEIRCLCAYSGESLVAGVIIFATQTAHHAQYIASSPQGHACSALDLLLEHCVACAEAEGVRSFDFGISTERESRMINAGLYNYKTEFGSGSKLYQTYSVPLDQ